MRRRWLAGLLCVALGVALGVALAGPARAEVDAVALPKQYGIAFIPFLLMEDGKLIEKHAEALGLPRPTVRWVQLSGAGPVNDGLLSGALSFGAGAAPSLILLWDRTRTSRNPVRGIGAVATLPTVLVSRNPAVRTIADFGPGDRIAVPTAKLSNAAIVLQMAAAKLWGQAEYARLDPLTVSMSHPDALAQLLNGGGVTAHFASPPFQLPELRDRRVHEVLNSVDVMGDATLTDVWTTESFATANPRTVQAVFDAMAEAIDTINRDRGAAADVYLRMTGDPIARADLLSVLHDPHTIYSVVPRGTMQFASFLHGVGVVRGQPASWTELFFPIARGLPGS